MSRFEIVRSFTEGTTGKFLTNPLIEFVRCRAFRLEPIVSPGSNKIEGNLMVDGEPIEYGPIQGEVAAKRARILMPKI